MKVALCTIAKLENKYIREWVYYYKQKQFDKIFLYDNNDTWGEFFTDIISDYIDSGFVEVINYRGKKHAQCIAYQDCWDKHNKEYDWIAFFDCDEFIGFNKEGVNNIHSYLSTITDYDMVHINFLTFGDNNLIYNNTHSLIGTFKTPLPALHKGPLQFPNNCHIKTIIRGGINNIDWVTNQPYNPHTPLSKNVACCAGDGKTAVDPNLSIAHINYDCAVLMHYSTKTIAEFIINKILKGFAWTDREYTISSIIYDLLLFYSFNEITFDKIQATTKLIKDIYETEHNLVFSEARGRLGNILFTIATGKYYADTHNKEFCLYVNDNICQYKEDDNYISDIVLNHPCLSHINSSRKVDNIGLCYSQAYEENSITYNKLPDEYNGNLFIRGFRQSPKYFERNWAIKTFKPSKDILKYIKKTYKHIDFENTVAVHIRRTDYLDKGNEWLVTVNPIEWYHHAISNFSSDTKFLIISDDIEWCKTQFIGDRYYFAVDNKDYATKLFSDLYIQTLCKANIISNSTFAWWGAYLNIHKDRVVYYKSPWFKTTDCLDIIPENDNWINI